MPIPYFNSDPDKPETVVPTDVPLSAAEALEIADLLDDWPPGLGWVLERDSTRPRGWRRHRTYKPFDKVIPPASDDVKHCPVVTLKVLRNESGFGPHLAAFRVLRNAVAEETGLDLRAARLHYNELLRSNPPALATLLRAYARRENLVTLYTHAYNYLTPEQRDDLHSNFRDDTGEELPYHRDGASARSIAIALTANALAEPFAELPSSIIAAYGQLLPDEVPVIGIDPDGTIHRP